MAGEIKSDESFQIGHVLFIDIVGYSKLPIEEQREAVEELSQIVRQTEQFCAAGEAGQLVSLPAGDGMALVFSTTVEAPVHCAFEIARKLKGYPELPVRMGIHSGPVSGVTDVNDRSNVAGAGINMAQRVMELGDAGHVLLSQRVADDLEQYRQWRPHLHDLGECEVKHGKKLSIVNFYTGEVGNPEVPEKFREAKETKPGRSDQVGRRHWWPRLLSLQLLPRDITFSHNGLTGRRRLLPTRQHCKRLRKNRLPFYHSKIEVKKKPMLTLPKAFRTRS